MCYLLGTLSNADYNKLTPKAEEIQLGENGTAWYGGRLFFTKSERYCQYYLLKIDATTVRSPTAVLSRLQLSETTGVVPLIATNFHLFPVLPTELRIKIWEYCALVPYVFHVIYEVEHDIPANYTKYGAWKICNPRHTPIFDHVCQEAKYVADTVQELDIMSLEGAIHSDLRTV